MVRRWTPFQIIITFFLILSLNKENTNFFFYALLGPCVSPFWIWNLFFQKQETRVNVGKYCLTSRTFSSGHIKSYNMGGGRGDHIIFFFKFTIMESSLQEKISPLIYYVQDWSSIHWCSTYVKHGWSTQLTKKIYIECGTSFRVQATKVYKRWE